MKTPTHPKPPNDTDVSVDQHGYRPAPAAIRPGQYKEEGGYVPTGDVVPKPPTTGSGVKPPPAKPEN